MVSEKSITDDQLIELLREFEFEWDKRMAEQKERAREMGANPNGTFEQFVQWHERTSQENKAFSEELTKRLFEKVNNG